MTPKSRPLLALAGLAFLAGCAEPTFNPDDPNQRTRSGAIMGATTGAIIGAATAGGNPARSALTGAVVGGLGGAIVGNIIDNQARELQRDIQTPGVQIVNMGDRLVVVMPNGLTFATNEATIQPAIISDLLVVAESLTRYPDSRVQVVGHTDITGPADFNKRLSLQRANSVIDILRRGGVASNRMFPIGMGPDQPVATNDTAEGRAQNRRVEIQIIPTG